MTRRKDTRLAQWRRDPKLRLRQAKDRIRSSLWFAPALGAIVALAAAFVLVRLDARVVGHRTWLFDGGPDSARELLSTIASSMLTFTALVFSITILALQLASNQFSPRVIRTFLQERVTKLALAMFVGTFVYSVAVLSTVRSIADPFVPAISTWVALVLILASVGVFIRYIHRMAHSVRAITVITTIASETRAGIDHVFPEHGARADCASMNESSNMSRPDTIVRHRGAPAVLTFVDTAKLVDLAARSGSRFRLVPRIGDFVPTGAELLHVFGPTPDAARCCAALAFDIERTPHQDPAFGFRQLVDIAVRAVSPSLNDPSTAVQALDQLHDLLRRLAVRDLTVPPYRDEAGAIRFCMRRRSFSELVRLAFDEIHDYGASSRQVRTRIRHALADCIDVARDEHRDTLQAYLRAVDGRNHASAEPV